MDTEQRIYSKLLQLIPDLATKPSHRKSVVAGFMDLNLDLMEVKNNQLVIALSHYYQHPSGDMIADPDMTVLVDIDNHRAQPLSYQDTMIYQQVHINGTTNQRLKQQLTAFLDQWLTNCIEQGHNLS